MQTRPQDDGFLWKLVPMTIGSYGNWSPGRLVDNGNSSANTRVCFSQKQWRLPPQI